MKSTTMTERKYIKISHNPWYVPDPDHALDGWLEGGATKKEISQARAKARKERAAWQPTEEGMQLAEQMKVFIGTRVQIQFWDSCMLACDEEAPYPLEADCKDVLLMQQGKFLQAYMVLDNVRAIPTPEGYMPRSYLIAMGGIPGQLAALANVYEVWPVNADGSVPAELEQSRISVVQGYNARMTGLRKMLKDSMPEAQICGLYPLWNEQAKKQDTIE